jgi:hypothetical protein
MSNGNSEVFDPKASGEEEADSSEKSTSRLIAIDRELQDQSTSRITWQHSKRTFTTTAEITLSDAYLYDLMSPDIGNLCKSFEKLDCED